MSSKSAKPTLASSIPASFLAASKSLTAEVSSLVLAISSSVSSDNVEIMFSLIYVKD